MSGLFRMMLQNAVELVSPVMESLPNTKDKHICIYTDTDSAGAALSSTAQVN